MRRKTLLTAMLCMVLAIASQSVCSDHNSVRYVKAESGGAAVSADVSAGDPGAASETTPSPTPEQKETPSPTPEPPKQTETTAPTPEPPKQTETSTPETPKQTETTAPTPETPKQTETSAPAPEQTETSAPTPDGGSTGEQGSTGGAGETDPANPGANPETSNPETGGAEAQQTEIPGGTVPTEAPVPETPQTETLLTEAQIEEKPFVVPDRESEEESESETEHLTNEELIARQQIVIPPEIEKEFRFTEVEKQYAIVRNPDGAQVYEKKSADARAVGTLNYYGCCYILEDQKDGWYYIESGNVRGFIQSEEVVAGEVANRIVRIKGMEELPSARLLVARPDNAAFTYTHTTVQPVMASPEYALAAGEVNIYEQKKDTARVIGTMSEKDLCYILDKTDDTWVFVESGDARGFVEKKGLTFGQTAADAVAETGEENMPLAEVLVKPEENNACYYTLTSVKEASQGAKTREAMIVFAKQFLGNPYVWGGTSLTQGADCSGFVQSIYSYFGYSLPRVAEDQAVYGMQIPIENAEPGDLIFYARNGYVYHVSMYIGDGQVIQAAGRKVGIIVSGIGDNAVWATRVIKD